MIEVVATFDSPPIFTFQPPTGALGERIVLVPIADRPRRVQELEDRGLIFEWAERSAGRAHRQGWFTSWGLQFYSPVPDGFGWIWLSRLRRDAEGELQTTYSPAPDPSALRKQRDEALDRLTRYVERTAAIEIAHIERADKAMATAQLAEAKASLATRRAFGAASALEQLSKLAEHSGASVSSDAILERVAEIAAKLIEGLE